MTVGALKAILDNFNDSAEVRIVIICTSFRKKPVHIITMR